MPGDNREGKTVNTNNSGRPLKTQACPNERYFFLEAFFAPLLLPEAFFPLEALADFLGADFFAADFLGAAFFAFFGAAFMAAFLTGLAFFAGLEGFFVTFLAGAAFAGAAFAGADFAGVDFAVAFFTGFFCGGGSSSSAASGAGGGIGIDGVWV
jgi:uncharacterized protein YjbI with pentapeptide repeats